MNYYVSAKLTLTPLFWGESLASRLVVNSGGPRILAMGMPYQIFGVSIDNGIVLEYE